MKLILTVFALSTAVSAAAVEKYECGGECTLEYAPIRCSNGSKDVTYNNLCEYKRAQKCDPDAFYGLICTDSGKAN